MQSEHTAADYYFDSYAHFGKDWVSLLMVMHAPSAMTSSLV